MDFTWTACCPASVRVNDRLPGSARSTVSSVAAVYDRRTLRDREASNTYLLSPSKRAARVSVKSPSAWR